MVAFETTPCRNTRRSRRSSVFLDYHRCRTKPCSRKIKVQPTPEAMACVRSSIKRTNFDDNHEGSETGRNTEFRLGKRMPKTRCRCTRLSSDIDFHHRLECGHFSRVFSLPHGSAPRKVESSTPLSLGLDGQTSPFDQVDQVRELSFAHSAM